MASMVEFRNEVEYKSPFFLPFVFAMGLGTLGGILMIWLRLAYGIETGLLFIGIGALCGWGTRLGDGDYSSALLALALVQSMVVLVAGSVEVARDLDVSYPSLILEVMRQGKFTGLLNQCVAAFFVGGLTVKSMVFAYLAAWGVYKLGRD